MPLSFFRLLWFHLFSSAYRFSFFLKVFQISLPEQTIQSFVWNISKFPRVPCLFSSYYIWGLEFCMNFGQNCCHYDWAPFRDSWKKRFLFWIWFHIDFEFLLSILIFCTLLRFSTLSTKLEIESYVVEKSRFLEAMRWRYFSDREITHYWSAFLKAFAW